MTHLIENSRPETDSPEHDSHQASSGINGQSKPTSPSSENSPSPEPAQSKPGTASPVLRTGLNLLAVFLVVLAAILLWRRIQSAPGPDQFASGNAQASGLNALAPANSGNIAAAALAPFITPSSFDDGIVRQVSPKTIIPNRPRENVITYTVQVGDNLFSIADKYGLKPETLLWGNYDTLKDNPEILKPDQVLNILPVDGTYYQWKQYDTLEGVASFFKVKPDAIIDYPGNNLDLTTSITSTTAINPDTWLIVPDGKRAIKDWGPPAISRSNPAVARYYGPGSCGSIYEGAIGTGVFVWPTTEHWISGYTFSSIHPAIDIAGQLGNAVYAADSGVVVYAGWSNYGYGNLLVIDHGNGWQTAYAHLNSIGVSCGQSVTRGIMVAALGTTGNSSGPHLHFEMSYNGAKVNPLDYIK
jgi:murein DD-endopeptidase MepM/ murein hydrolase activator NlpD